MSKGTGATLELLDDLLLLGVQSAPLVADPGEAWNPAGWKALLHALAAATKPPGFLEVGQWGATGVVSKASPGTVCRQVESGKLRTLSLAEAELSTLRFVPNIPSDAEAWYSFSYLLSTAPVGAAVVLFRDSPTGGRVWSRSHLVYSSEFWFSTDRLSETVGIAIRHSAPRGAWG